MGHTELLSSFGRQRMKCRVVQVGWQLEFIHSREASCCLSFSREISRIFELDVGPFERVGWHGDPDCFKQLPQRYPWAPSQLGDSQRLIDRLRFVLEQYPVRRVNRNRKLTGKRQRRLFVRESVLRHASLLVHQQSETLRNWIEASQCVILAEQEPEL